MMHLHTLGDSLIKVGEKEIRPTSPLVFAALLYLGMERGRRVPRAALQELLFPESDERSGTHSLRQLLYKLRQLGVRPEADSVAVWLPAELVKADFDQSLDELDRDLTRRISLGIVPGFVAPSEQYATWLDEKRTGIVGRFRGVLLPKLREADSAGDVAVMEQ